MSCMQHRDPMIGHTPHGSRGNFSLKSGGAFKKTAGNVLARRSSDVLANAGGAS